MEQQKKCNNDSWKTRFKSGEMGFSKEAERKFFFYMTIMMLLAGIFVKLT